MYRILRKSELISEEIELPVKDADADITKGTIEAQAFEGISCNQD